MIGAPFLYASCYFDKAFSIALNSKMSCSQVVVAVAHAFNPSIPGGAEPLRPLS